jgi:hypothetical protein
MQTFKITLKDAEPEYVQCTETGIAPNGALVCASNPVGTLYAPGYWLKVEPASVQLGQVLS